MTEPWETLLKIFGGVVLAGIIGAVGAAVQRRNEHAKWRRERQYEVYAEFLAATFDREAGHDKERIITAFAKIAILGPSHLVAKTERMMQALAAYRADRSNSELKDAEGDARAELSMAVGNLLGAKYGRENLVRKVWRNAKLVYYKDKLRRLRKQMPKR